MKDPHRLSAQVKQQEAALRVALYALKEINQGSAAPHKMLSTARIALDGIRDITNTAIEFAAARGYHPEAIADLTEGQRD